VHHPFIPSPWKPSSILFPSLTICTNAARSCVHVVDLQHRRAPQPPSSHFQLPVFTAGIVLRLNIWGAKHTGGVPSPAKEIEDVRKCMAVIQAAEGDWDLLYELASVGDLPLPQLTQSSAKHERDSDSQADSPMISMQSSVSTSTSGRTPAPPKVPHQPTQRVSVSPPTSSLGTPYVDALYGWSKNGSIKVSYNNVSRTPCRPRPR